MSNLELGYEIVTHIDGISIILTNAYCCVVWIRSFLDQRKKAWIAGGAYAITMLILSYMPWYINNVLAYAIGTLMVFLVMSLLDRKYFLQKLFLVTTFFCLRWQTFRIVVHMNNEVSNLFYQIFTMKDDLWWFLEFVFITIFSYDIFAFFLLYSAVKCMLWSYGQKREHMDGREFLLLSTPSLLGVVSYYVLDYYRNIYERDVGKSIYNLYGSYDLIMSLFTLLSFAVILVTAYVFRQWKTKQEEDRQQEIFSAQMADLQNHISEMEQLYRDMRGLRHDVGNHLMTIKQLYDRGEFDAAQQYTDKLNEEMAASFLGVNSGNPVTDVILSGRKMEMEEKGISFSCNFHYPMTDMVNSFDISIILNNALSNAIEAVEREKFSPGKTPQVSLVSGRRKNMYMIEVSNTFTGNLETDPVSGLPRTSKTGEGHGFGLANIRHAARKYLGDIEIGKEVREGEECCVLRVMLQIPET